MGLPERKSGGWGDEKAVAVGIFPIWSEHKA